MRAYKLTDENGQTYRGMQWGPDVTHEAPGTGELCTAGWIHVYTHPLLAVLLNPIHANFKESRLWECRVVKAGMKTDHGLKLGVRKATTLREILLPEITLEQTVTFGILCAKSVYPDPGFVKWADGWLSGEDRSAADAAAVADAATPARAAWSAGSAAWSATDAARSATDAAGAAARAAGAAAAAAADIDLIALAEEAMKVGTK